VINSGVLTNKISVLPFSSIEPNKNYVLCRVADTISTPNNESFEKYIENAFKEELKMSDLYDSQSSIKISGHLKKIISLSMPGNTYWEINVDIKSNNGKSFSVSTKYEYAATFMAYTACNNMANTFAPTIKLLINKIITHPKFTTLIEDNR
jgi:hypothetical protein